MRFFAPLALVAFALSATAVPITPSAPELQRRAEQFRLQGLQEHEIAEKLTLPPTTSALDESLLPTSLVSTISAKLRTFVHPCSESDAEDHDVSGDIAPGSLEAPQMLPRPVAALVEPSALGRIVALLGKKGDEAGNYAYEGKELELRRPTGMRHWGAADKWRLF